MKYHKVHFLLAAVLFVTLLGMQSLFASEGQVTDCPEDAQGMCGILASTEQVNESTEVPESPDEPTQPPTATETIVGPSPSPTQAPTQIPESTEIAAEATEAPEATPDVEATNEVEVTSEAVIPEITSEAPDVVDDPFQLSVTAECTDLGVEFSILNSGGAMDMPLTYSLDTQSGSILLDAGEQVTIDAGFGQPVLQVDGLTEVAEACAPPGRLSGRVWNDRDANGTWSESEAGLANVTVRVTGDAGFSAEAVTDTEGKYDFAALADGTYVVSVVPESLPAAFVQTFDNDSVRDGQTTVSISRGVDNLADFGYREQILSVLGGYVWNDLNRNGLFDAGESGVPGVNVSLSSARGETTSLVTGANGYFGFSGVFEGDYTVSLNPSSLPSRLFPGTSPNISFSVVMGEARDNLFFGLQNPAESSVSGSIYQQYGGDTVFTILLHDANGALVASTQTDAAGGFAFSQLGAGRYMVSIDTGSLPAGIYLPSDDSDGGTDAAVSVMLDGTNATSIYFNLLISA